MRTLQREVPTGQDIDDARLERCRTSLTDLPAELLLKILAEDHEFATRRSLRTLRLVCHYLDSIVKDRAVAYLRLGGDIAKIEAMAAVSTVFDSSVKTLRLEGHHYPPGHRGWNALADLITKMKGIQTVEWIDEGTLNEAVVDAMARLPMLDNIKFKFLHVPPSDRLRLPQAMLTRLKAITLDFACFHYTNTGQPAPVIDPKTKRGLRYLITSTPNLEHLEVGPTGLEILTLEFINKELERRADFRPSICSIAAKAITLLPTSPSSMGAFLSLLSSLQIPNIRDSDQSVWTTLRTSGIQLKVIKVEIASIALFQYVSAYQGLHAFHVAGWDAIVHNLFASALPGHRATLTDLRLLVAKYTHHPSMWPESNINLTPLHRFRRLEILDLVFQLDHEDNATGRHMKSVLNSLTTLSNNLKVFYLHATSNARSESRRIDDHRKFLHRIGQFRFIIRPSNWKTLRVVVRTLEPNFSIPGVPQVVTHIAHRVAPLKDYKTHGLRLDYGLTELMNEGNEYYNPQVERRLGMGLD